MRRFFVALACVRLADAARSLDAGAATAYGGWNPRDVAAVVSRWPGAKLAHLRRAANQTRWHGLLTSAVPAARLHGDGSKPWTFLQAGDLVQMWLRDSTV